MNWSRVKFEVEHKDYSSTMMATMFEDHAEKYFSITGEKLMNETSKVIYFYKFCSLKLLLPYFLTY